MKKDKSMNKVNKKIISTLLEWGDTICDENCKNCILNKDVDCTSEFTTDYCTMLNHLAKELGRIMDKELRDEMEE